MSQNKDILNHLQTKGRIDSITALKTYGCFRLAARINDLRNQDHNIKTKKVNHQGKTFAVYTIN